MKEKASTKRELVYQWFAFNNEARTLEGTEVKSWTESQVDRLVRKYSEAELNGKVEEAKAWRDKAYKGKVIADFLKTNDGQAFEAEFNERALAKREEIRAIRENSLVPLTKVIKKIAGTDWYASEINMVVGEKVHTTLKLRHNGDEAGCYLICMDVHFSKDSEAEIQDMTVDVYIPGMSTSTDSENVELLSAMYKAIAKILASHTKFTGVCDILNDARNEAEIKREELNEIWDEYAERLNEVLTDKSNDNE